MIGKAEKAQLQGCLKAIQGRQSEMLAMLEKLVRLESPSSDAGEARAAGVSQL
jgi:hypothetical protein